SNPLDTANADSNGVFQLRVPADTLGFIGCTPPHLSGLGLSTFASTTGQKAGDIIMNLTVSPATTLVADILVSTKPPNLQTRADDLTKALAAGDADLPLLAQAITTLYNAQLDNMIDVDSFTGGGEPSEDSPGSPPGDPATDGTDPGEGGGGAAPGIGVR